MFEYMIVADDYTGAIETASKFINGGYRSSVTLNPRLLESMQQFTVVALDTETFFRSPKEAGEKLANVARDLLPLKNNTVFFKRVDPALRGNVGPEVCTMARELNFEYVVLALSRDRRFTEEGTTCLNTQEHVSSLTVTGCRPATHKVAADTLRKEGFYPTEVSLEDIRNGKISEIIKKKGYFCFDSETDKDLKAIVRGVLNVTPAKSVLWVGTTGLAKTLAMSKPFIVVIGTPHPRSIRQARRLLAHAMAYPVQLDVGILKSSGDSVIDVERKRVAEEAEILLRCGHSILLVATVSGRFVCGSYPNDDIDGFLDFIAETVRDVIGRVKIGGLCVTGGNCSMRIVQKAQAENLVLTEEVQEGITLSRLNGGPFDGLSLITKSGALGGEGALVYCMECFMHIR
jgi:uncharacterized protein YgbK (DUF1537 family)